MNHKPKPLRSDRLDVASSLVLLYVLLDISEINMPVNYYVNEH